MNSGKSWWPLVALLAMAGGVALYVGGFFGGERTAPGDVPASAGLPVPGATARAERQRVQVSEDAVGTVRSRRTIALAAQIPASVLAVEVEAGATVHAGDVLVQLDDREFVSRVAQAREAGAAAEAGIARAAQVRAQAQARLAQAKAHFERTSSLHAASAATSVQLEAAEADHLAASASVAEAEAAGAVASAERERARQSELEAGIALGYATLRAPIDGVVAERLVESGDLAWPGRTLLVVLDPRALRLEARVREGLIERIVIGSEYDLELGGAPGVHVRARISELLPSADPQSRSFEVRADFDAPPGVYPGMFGRLRIVSGERDIVVAPASAVVRIGQLESVIVDDGGRWVRRSVTTGAAQAGGMLEVLSGLRGGETLGTAAEGAR